MKAKLILKSFHELPALQVGDAMVARSLPATLPCQFLGEGAAPSEVPLTHALVRTPATGAWRLVRAGSPGAQPCPGTE